MKTAANDVAAIVRDWSPEERKLALAILIGDTFAENGEQLFPVRDENDRSLAIVEPFRFSAREIVLDDSTPYLRELRRRVETSEDSLPLDEFLAQIEQEEEASVFYPNLDRVNLSDGSGRWFDRTSSRAWNQATQASTRETLYLTKGGAFVWHFNDSDDPSAERSEIWDQGRALKWLAANGHEVSTERLVEAKEIRRLEV